MLLPEPRQQGTLIQRYKRFLADIRLTDDKILTVHCPNSGSMRGCSAPGSQVIISRSANPKRKYPWTLEIVRDRETWIGVNTGLTNKIVREALENGTIRDFGKIISIRQEVKISTKSRLDFLIETTEGDVYLEVKNCSLAHENTALFPDAVTARGTKHMEELINLAGNGKRAAVLFCVQRGDARRFTPAAEIDPVYTDALCRAAAHGVKVLAYQADVRPESVTITHPLPVALPED